MSLLAVASAVTTPRNWRLAGAATLLLLPACRDAADDPPQNVDAGAAEGRSLSSAIGLPLVSEKKLSKLLPKKEVGEYEASGVVAFNGMLYVASDNVSKIAQIDTALGRGKLGPGNTGESQYEAITVTDDGRFFVMIESTSKANGPAEVAELDADTALVERAFTDTTFDHPNKGFEGVAWLRVAGTEYLLALCENNDCKDDDSPPGEGRVKVLAKTGAAWATQATLKLPEAVAFQNYSDLALRDDGDGSFTVAIVSHKSSALWLGRLSTAPWALQGPNRFYTFPRTDEGLVRYCSVEGITFLGPTVLAVVSDKSDGSMPCTDEEASIHIFQLPQ